MPTIVATNGPLVTQQKAKQVAEKVQNTETASSTNYVFSGLGVDPNGIKFDANNESKLTPDVTKNHVTENKSESQSIAAIIAAENPAGFSLR